MAHAGVARGLHAGMARRRVVDRLVIACARYSAEEWLTVYMLSVPLVALSLDVETDVTVRFHTCIRIYPCALGNRVI